jgi:ADP-ribosylglycohydrolase
VKSPVDSRTLRETYAGVLLGTAVGDALGLPAENLSPEQIRRRWNGKWRMRFLIRRGMFSDDTEHTLMVAQALLAYPDDPDAFQRAIAWKLWWWFLALPAGVGLATAKACLKLWLGFPAHRSAVTSAGSGPAMRSAIIGAFFADDPRRRREFVLASSRLTHRAWQADTAALAVAEMVAFTITEPFHNARILSVLQGLSGQTEWQNWVARIRFGLEAGDSVWEFVNKAGMHRGVTGYALHVVPVALYAWLVHRNDFRAALSAALECGGDTDTVGAILGAMCGATAGEKGIPADWLGAICEWPRSVGFIGCVAQRLAAAAAAA